MKNEVYISHKNSMWWLFRQWVDQTEVPPKLTDANLQLIRNMVFLHGTEGKEDMGTKVNNNDLLMAAIRLAKIGNTDMLATVIEMSKQYIEGYIRGRLVDDTKASEAIAKSCDSIRGRIGELSEPDDYYSWATKIMDEVLEKNYLKNTTRKPKSISTICIIIVTVFAIAAILVKGFITGVEKYRELSRNSQIENTVTLEESNPEETTYGNSDISKDVTEDYTEQYLSDLRDALYTSINEYRVAQGLGEITISLDLENVAADLNSQAIQNDFANSDWETLVQEQMSEIKDDYDLGEISWQYHPYYAEEEVEIICNEFISYNEKLVAEYEGTDAISLINCSEMGISAGVRDDGIMSYAFIFY